MRCLSPPPLPFRTHVVDVEGDSGSPWQPAQSQVDVGLGARQDDEVADPQGPGNLDKILQHISMSHLLRGNTISTPLYARKLLWTLTFSLEAV